MYVSERHRFIYFALTKVASQTVAKACIQFLGAKQMRPTVRTAKVCDEHHSIFLPEKYKDYFLFVSARNPYLRELSKFNYGVARDQLPPYFMNTLDDTSFERYINWVCEKMIVGKWRRFDLWKYSMKEMVFNLPMLEPKCVPITRLDAVIKHETLLDDFLKLPFVKDTPELRLLFKNKINATVDPKIDRFPEHLAERYYNAFQEDFEYFGYPKEVPDFVVKPVASYRKICFNGPQIIVPAAKNIPLL